LLWGEKSLPFIYFGQGVAILYKDFVERLMSQLALQGTEITNKKIGAEKSHMDVKYIDERGKMYIAIDGENVKVVYDVQRDRKEVKRGLRGAIAGGGIGGILGGVLRKSDDVKDRVVDTVSGAMAGGAYEAYEGYEESKEDRTKFAQELADAVKDVEDQLQYIVRGQKAARESLREKARAKMDAEAERSERIMLEIEEVFADILSVKEEAELAEFEGTDVKKSKVRVDRAEKLLKDAREALEKHDYMVAKGKLRAAKTMVKQARDLL
jgi:outer membrane lipoprotein SlyB